MKPCQNLNFFLAGKWNIFNGHLKPKIVKIGRVIISGGDAQNMKILFLKRCCHKKTKNMHKELKKGIISFPPTLQQNWATRNLQCANF